MIAVLKSGRDNSQPELFFSEVQLESKSKLEYKFHRTWTTFEMLTEQRPNLVTFYILNVFSCSLGLGMVDGTFCNFKDISLKCLHFY